MPQANSASAIAELFWEHLSSDIRQAKSLIRFWRQKILCAKGRKPRKKNDRGHECKAWVVGGLDASVSPASHLPPPILLSIQVSNHQPADFPHNVTTIKFSNLQGTNNFCYNDIEKTTFYFVKANYDIDRHRKGVG